MEIFVDTVINIKILQDQRGGKMTDISKFLSVNSVATEQTQQQKPSSNVVLTPEILNEVERRLHEKGWGIYKKADIENQGQMIVDDILNRYVLFTKKDWASIQKTTETIDENFKEISKTIDSVGKTLRGENDATREETTEPNLPKSSSPFLNLLSKFF